MKIPLWTQIPLFIGSLFSIPKIFINELTYICNACFILFATMTIFLVIYQMIKEDFKEYVKNEIKKSKEE